jgi:hypothetical protein
MVDVSEHDWARIEASLRSAGALGEPAEVHAEFCGLACVMGKDAAAPWAESALADAPQKPAEVLEELRSLAETTWTSLDSGDMSFGLLLPPDETPLEVRAEALGAWCQGFMHGLGVAGAPGKDSPIARNDVIRDIVGDFSEITRASFADSESEEEGEAAFVELVEYVRVGAQLVFEELHPLRSAKVDTGRH